MISGNGQILKHRNFKQTFQYLNNIKQFRLCIVLQEMKIETFRAIYEQNQKRNLIMLSDRRRKV